jgi:16S rRNA G527 N7-methylase RsmG
MKIYSFTEDCKLKRESNVRGAPFDLFRSTVTDKDINNIKLYLYIVPPENIGRLDKISVALYGSNEYVDELMKINNIINPYSINEKDEILYPELGDIVSTHLPIENETVASVNINNAKNTRKDANRKNTTVPVVVKDTNAKQVEWNKENKTLSIINIIP